MTTMQTIALLITPIGGLIIGGIMMFVVDRSAKREDRSHPSHPAE
ncbi:hypothetical protein [Falsirhodobacter xinxiangensis]|nr:hypothetical protein [Rhodobacter xinxiangensis]